MKNTKIPRGSDSSKNANQITVGTMVKSIPLSQIQERSLSWPFSYRHFNNMWRVKLVLCARANIKQYSQCFK